MTFVDIIRQLRKDKQVSQSEVAEAIGVARATYASLEANRRPPNLQELTRLADYYNVGVSELILGVNDLVQEASTAYNYSPQASVIELNDSHTRTDSEKLREVLLYVLEVVAAKPNFGEDLLHRLLFFIDHDYYQKCGQSITGMAYIVSKHGAIPGAELAAVVKAMQSNEELEIVETKKFKNKQKKYLPLRSSDLKNISGHELRHIDETLARLGNKSVAEIDTMSKIEYPNMYSGISKDQKSI